MQQLPPRLTGSDQEAIENLTGLQPVSCACKACADLCKRISCMGTPQDMLNLINAGYGERLRPVMNVHKFPGYSLPSPIIHFMPLYDPKIKACTFLKDDLCILHDLGLKPTEGRLSDCKTTKMPAGKIELPMAVLLTWLRPENRNTIRLIDKAVSKYNHDYIPVIVQT